MADGRFTLSRKAIADLDSIWDYTTKRWSEQQAETYYRLLIHACQEAANATSSGMNYDAVRKGLKGIKAGRHIVFYRAAGIDTIEVVRILHERMDLPNRIKE